MLIIDAHLDLSMNALQGNRDLLRSAYTIRTQETGIPGKGQGTVAYPEMRQGRIALSFVTLFARSTGRPAPHFDFASPVQACGVAQGQLAYYRALEETGHVRIITALQDLDNHIADWQAWETDTSDPDNTPPLGFVISMEGADPILQPDQLEVWVNGGLRLIGLTHYGPGRYAGGTGTEIGLTELGPPLLAEMERLGVILDLTHCSDQSFWQALEHYSGLVLASHNNCRALVPHQRQFSDEQLRAIFERDGVIGAAFDAWMLHPGWVTGETPHDKVTLSTVVDHIDYICQLAGNSRHAAIGTDLDGGYGREQSPSDLDTIADLQNLTGLLEARGYSTNDIAAIMHGNWLRFLHDAWD
ncbi:MAG: membrane dipeptidase [Candidatus Poribacteria bacterium]|nr:membrane dipeptidase [Candidatus Poribacteria bacterium]